MLYVFQVKIIKCLVENIVVDISFNQVGGLCTLCFLDEVSCTISFLKISENMSFNYILYTSLKCTCGSLFVRLIV